MVEWFRALDFNSVAPGSNPALATSWSCFSVDPSSTLSSAMLVHSRLFCLRAVGILTCYIQFIISFIYTAMACGAVYK